MRDYYRKRYQTIHDDLLRMGSQVEHALADALRAIETWNSSLAQQIIDSDRQIDAAQIAIEDAIHGLLATQQPVVATDLRVATATIAIAGELERAGDYTKGIARRVSVCLRSPALLEPPPRLCRMGVLAQSMVYSSLDAFVRRDIALARSLAIEDVQVDALEDQVVAELLNAARKNLDTLECALALIDVAHFLERLADRATNIAERVIFITTSTIEQLNP